MSPTLVTQSRMASLMASLRVALPLETPCDFGAEHAHAEDVQALAAHVLFAHVDDAFEAEQGADGGGGDAVLSGAGFGDDAPLAHAAGEERLSEAVVDLVRAGVEQVFALEPDARAAEGLAEVFGEVERRGAAGVVVQEIGELGLEGGVVARREIGGFEFFDGRHQDFGDVAPAVGSEVSAGIGLGGHAPSAALAACRKSIIFMWSFFPGERFDARAGIDAPGLGERDGARDVGGIEAAGHDDAMAGVAGEGPIEGVSGAAVEFGGGAVEQEGFGGAIVQVRKIEVRGDARGFPDGDGGGVLGGRFVAVQLGHVEGGKARDFGDARRGFVDEDADAADAGGGDAGGGFGRDVARAFGVEVEADGGGAGGNGGVGVGLVGDAADLEMALDHAATSFRRAAAGSPDFMRCSPTRKAW